jgi:hypothetical protein
VAAVPGVRSLDYLPEFLLSRVYMPGEGLRSLPLYVMDDPERYLDSVYSEEVLGAPGSFNQVVHQLRQGQIAVSPAVAEFWDLRPGSQLLLGSDPTGGPVRAPVGGTVRYLPGRPLETVTDRQSFARAQVDYLNFLFDNNAYAVASSDNPSIAGLVTSAPRVALLVKLAPGVDVQSVLPGVLASLPAAPLEVRQVDQEVAKVGSDMFVELGLQNMRIYLVAGLALALISMASVALANYAQDRRTLALLRIRGAGPALVLRFFATSLLVPALLGLLLGGSIALVAGYGMTNTIWSLRDIHRIVLSLPTHLQVTPLTGGVLLILVAAVGAIGYAFTVWAFQRTAHASLTETR